MHAGAISNVVSRSSAEIAFSARELAPQIAQQRLRILPAGLTT